MSSENMLLLCPGVEACCLVDTASDSCRKANRVHVQDNPDQSLSDQPFLAACLPPGLPDLDWFLPLSSLHHRLLSKHFRS